MVRIAGSVSKGWLAKELGVAFDRSYYFDPSRRHAIDRQCHDYVQQKLGDLGLFHTESNLGRREYHASNQVLVGGIQPNMIVGMLVGASSGRPTTRMRTSPEMPRRGRPGPIARPADAFGPALVEQFDEQIRALRRTPRRRPMTDSTLLLGHVGAGGRSRGHDIRLEVSG